MAKVSAKLGAHRDGPGRNHVVRPRSNEWRSIATLENPLRLDADEDGVYESKARYWTVYTGDTVYLENEQIWWFQESNAGANLGR